MLLLVVSAIAPLSLALIMIILALLSKKLGDVTQRPAIFRWYFVSTGLILVSTALRVTDTARLGTLDAEQALSYDMLLMMGLLLAVVVTWQYWWWLLGERGTHPDKGADQRRSKRG